MGLGVGGGGGGRVGVGGGDIYCVMKCRLGERCTSRQTHAIGSLMSFGGSVAAFYYRSVRFMSSQYGVMRPGKPIRAPQALPLKPIMVIEAR